MPKQVECPTCGNQITALGAGPGRVTCRRCNSRVSVPGDSIAAIERSTPAVQLSFGGLVVVCVAILAIAWFAWPSNQPQAERKEVEAGLNGKDNGRPDKKLINQNMEAFKKDLN